MKKFLLFFSFTFYFWIVAFPQPAIKNVIFLVPDGTSLGVLSLARWYQFYRDTSQTRLSVDPLLCGMVKTHSSNAPIGDSAPTMSWYMTGYPSQTKFVSMYPPQSVHDLVPIDISLSYSPRITVMEAARIAQNKAIGLVFTCEFPNATPAATSAHWYDRSNYQIIMQQMRNNSIDVMIGGGAKLLTMQDSLSLTKKGYQVYKNRLNSFRNAKDEKLWALFGDAGKEGYMDNDWDRDTAQQPSLAEMTEKAIQLLSQNKEKNGFFLMVEGSKIDWAAHDNNPIGILSEFLAFDAAVKVAIDFAQKSGETLVVICPDHGNGGVSIGNKRSNHNYDKLSLTELMKPIIKGKQSKTHIGFTTIGHTGEDVFLAIYDPRPNQRLTGLITPTEINRYMYHAIGVPSLDSLTNLYYCKLTDMFNETAFSITPLDFNQVKITSKNNPNKTLIIEAHSNRVFLQEQIRHTMTPAIYVDKNKTWYISRECLQFFNSL